MLRSLRARLGLTYAAIAAVMLVVAYVVAERTIDAALVSSAAERLTIEAGLVVADSSGPRGATATDLAAGDLAVVLGGYGTAVAIIDANGQVLAAEANGADESVLQARLGASEYARVITSGETVHAVRPAPGGGRTLVVAAPVQLRTNGRPANPGQGNGQGRGLGNQKNGKPAGVAAGPANAAAQLAISLDGVDAAVAQGRAALQLAGLALLLIAVLAVWLITRAGLRPLERVAHAAESIAAGDLGARADVPAGDDEVGRVGRAFDDMAERVDATLRAQRAFAADASHELRSPLTVLGGYVDVLGRVDMDDATRSRTLDAMRREIDLSSLVDDVGAAARVIGASLHDVVVERDGRVPVVADPDRLTQAVMNLVDNAVRHTPPGGAIRVSAKRLDGAGVVEVANTGPPIPPDDLDHVFERFYRADRPAAVDGPPAGLGLAIVKAITEASGGSVHVSSTDGETTFGIRLPLAP